MSDPAGARLPLHVDAVSKRFERTVALDDVSFEVRNGEIFGILGPNGAGKTTLIRAILDFIRPDSGRIELFGRAFQPEDRNRIGYLPEERGLYPRQNVGALLEYLGTLKGLTRTDAAGRVRAWLERFEIPDAAAQTVEQLSKGNQQKLQLVAALLADPEIVILDEPMSGLDPVSTRLVMRIVRECAARGQTVLLSTHQMGMVEALCGRVFMIARGHQVLYGDLETIRQQHSTQALRVRASADYRACPLIQRIEADETVAGAVVIHLLDGARADDMLRWLVSAGASVDRFERLTTPLEEIFVRVVSQAPAHPAQVSA
jgi:ABC-2 type transport system ATP-binding protein